MSTDSLAPPPSGDAWVAAVHASEDDYQPLGTALVVADDRVLTCAHVIMGEGVPREGLWVAFPKAGDCPRRRVASVRFSYARPVRDVALLVLEEPVPAGAGAALLRFPRGQNLVGRGWWAFGFPDRDPVGDSADGQVGASLSYGWVRLDSTSRYLIRPGFSGAGLWSPDYQAVVGIVAQAHANGDGRAITLHQADLDLPEVNLAELAKWSAELAGEVALAQWGLTPRTPGRPGVRGVSIESERGWRFRGRAVALTQITSWLDRAQPDRRVLVVTGSPGVGKSAVLGRVVTTADAAIRKSLLAALPSADVGILASQESVSCAVHATGKTALEVAEEIARAASAALPVDPGNLAPAVRDALAGRPGSRFNVIIDALDEAADQARVLIESVVLPLAGTCADAGVQVVVGTRRRDDDGDILGRFGPALDLIDLDDPRYFAEDDLAAYALACLRSAGDKRPGNSYADDSMAVPLATAIAAISGQNFLIAGLIARSHGLHDDEPVSRASLGTEATVRTALAAYVNRLPDVAGIPAARLLTALAIAEAPGLPAGLWQIAIQALYQAHVSAQDLARFARSSAANFLVETSGTAVPGLPSPGVYPVYRLFHQALDDALLHDRSDNTPRADDERALTRAFTGHGRAEQWRNAPDYLLSSLPAHARAGGLIDDLLTDDDYLLHADLRRLIQVADDASSQAGRDRARLLHLTPQAITATPAERVAQFSVTEALDNLGTSYRDGRWQAPYRAQWAVARPRSEHVSFTGHQGAVNAVCAVTVGNRSLLASGSDDGSVRVWDPQTGEQLAVLEDDDRMMPAGEDPQTGEQLVILKFGQRFVQAVCAVTVDGVCLLASGGLDRSVRVWDPQTGEELCVLEGHEGGVNAVCAVTVDGTCLLASGGDDGLVRVWDPQAGEELCVMEGHEGGVNAVCAVTVGTRSLLASGGLDRCVRVWDPQTGAELCVLEGHEGGVNAVCAVTVATRSLLASGSEDGSVRVWDPQTGEQLFILEGHEGGVNAVCAVTVDGTCLLASGGDDGSVRVWDPQAGEQLTAVESGQGEVDAVCAVTVATRSLLASGGGDGTVRVWDPQAGGQLTMRDGGRSWVNAVCTVAIDGRDLLASGSLDGIVLVRNPQTGEELRILESHQHGVNTVCPVTVGRRSVLATGGEDGTVRVWDPRKGRRLAVLEGHHGQVNAVCAVSVGRLSLLASGGEDGTVWVWDPRTGRRLGELRGHQGEVTAVCSVTVDGACLLASGGKDGTVRVWHPRTGRHITLPEGHQSAVNAVCAVTVGTRSLLASGGEDGTVRVWDAWTGRRLAVLEGHQGGVNAVCAVTVDGTFLLASGSDDRTVRLWDPQAGPCKLTVQAQHQVLAVAGVAGSLAIGLDEGILMIRPNAIA